MIDEKQKRATWGSKADFLLTCIGWCVGLSNVWRFPYLCYKNGGGAFLIPYTLTLVCCGIPLLCLEFFIGQYSGMGALPLWEICPLFKGIGYGFVMVNTIIATYYIFVLALALRYLAASFTYTLPWTHCDNEWNTEFCREVSRNEHVAVGNETLSVDEYTSSENQSEIDNSTAIYFTPSEEYFSKRVLNMSSGIEDLGMISWELVLCLLVAWLIVYLATIKGIKSSGKVVYFTATFPYIMLTTLVIRGCLLPGAMQGIKYYLVPRWERLLDSQVWYSAAVQVFFSVGPAEGCFITMSSYNKFHNRCIRDALITAVVNCCTSFYAGFAVFSVLGYMSQEIGVDVPDVVQSGPGLAFVTYPRALATMPFAPFWSVLFFFMLLLLGIDSELVHVETLTTMIMDEFPVLRRGKWRYALSVVICGSMFCFGILFATQGGFYIFTLLDWYGTAFTLFIIGILESVVFVWIYGMKNLQRNYKEMFGHGLNIYFQASWSYISPIFVTAILLFSIVTWTPVSFGDYQYPWSAKIGGWVLVFASLIPLPTLALHRFFRAPADSFLQKLQVCTSPTDKFTSHVRRRMAEAENCESNDGSDDFRTDKQLMAMT